MKILIVGAGIGGSVIAECLQLHGYEVSLLDRQKGVAQETSAHKAALAHPHYGKAPNRLQRITQFANQLVDKKWAAYRTHQMAFQRLSEEDWVCKDFVDARLIEQGYTNTEVISLEPEEALKLVGIREHGILFKQAGIYDLPAISKSAIRDIPLTHQHWNIEISRIAYEQTKWQIFNSQNELVEEGDALVLCNGIDAKRLLEQLGINLDLRVVRGQLSRFEIDAQSQWMRYLPKIALCGDGYCVPPEQINGKTIWQVGSSYDEEIYDLTPWHESDEHNQQQALNLLAQQNLPREDLKPTMPFVGLRCVGSDRMPLIGPIPTQPGLFMATAFGARGVLWSSLAQEIITAHLESYFAGEAFLRAGFLAGASEAFSSELAAAVAPARFLAGLLRGRGSNSKPIFPSAPRTK